MAIVYNWVVSSMDEYPTTPENLNDVVFTIHWRRNATEIVGEGEDTKTYVAGFPGTTPCPFPNPESFIPYVNLTEAEVEAWLEQLVDVPFIDAIVTKNLQDQINPPVVDLPLPWVTTTTTTVMESTTTTTTTEE